MDQGQGQGLWVVITSTGTIGTGTVKWGDRLRMCCSIIKGTEVIGNKGTSKMTPVMGRMRRMKRRRKKQ